MVQELVKLVVSTVSCLALGLGLGLGLGLWLGLGLGRGLGLGLDRRKLAGGVGRQSRLRQHHVGLRVGR